MNTFCYIFIFAFEQFIAYTYFSNKFESKRKPLLIFLFYLVSFFTQYGISLFPISELNLLSFFLCNIIVTVLCYKITLKQTLFNVFLLEGLMITTELLAMFIMSAILNIDLFEYKVNDSIIFLETAVTKVLYFTVAYLFSKVSIKETHKNKIKDFSLILFILPLSSIVTIVSFVSLSLNTNPDKSTYILFSIVAIILLLSNVVIFYVHQKSVDILIENAEHRIINQRSEINQIHYSELQNQYELSSIMIHDIKKHFRIIRNYSEHNQNNEIIKYIDSVYDNMGIKTIRQFSNNKLINIIANRYSNLCTQYNINFYSDIRSIDFSFFSDPDLTALFDNLLENAYEAAKYADEKFIDIRIYEFNEGFVVFNIKNSIEKAPTKIKGRYASSKSIDKGHGFGIKSIERIAKKYNGQTFFTCDNSSKTFCAKVILSKNLSPTYRNSQ